MDGSPWRHLAVVDIYLARGTRSDLHAHEAPISINYQIHRPVAGKDVIGTLSQLHIQIGLAKPRSRFDVRSVFSYRRRVGRALTHSAKIPLTQKKITSEIIYGSNYTNFIYLQA